MLASYILSRTLVPTLARMLMPGEKHHSRTYFSPSEQDEGRRTKVRPTKSIFTHFNETRERGFEKFQDSYGRMLEGFLIHRPFALAMTGAVAVVSILLINIVGTDFFPATDTGLMKLHFRAPAGT